LNRVEEYNSSVRTKGKQRGKRSLSLGLCHRKFLIFLIFFSFRFPFFVQVKHQPRDSNLFGYWFLYLSRNLTFLLQNKWSKCYHYYFIFIYFLYNFLSLFFLFEI